MKKSLCYLLGFVLIALAARQFYRAACDSHVTEDPFLNGDTLFCAGVYQDLVVDGFSWKGWRYSAATVIYPDMIVYFSARAITGSVGAAMVVCSAVFFALLLLSCHLLIRTMTSPEHHFTQTCIVLLLGAMFLLFNAKCGISDTFLRFPFILTFHGGEQICLVLDLALINYLIQSPSWDRRHSLALVGLFVNTMLCVLSDRLIIGHLVIPGIVALLVCRRLLGNTESGLSLQKIGVISGCLISATLTGKQLLRVLYPAWQDLVNYTPFNLKYAVDCFNIIFNKWTLYLLAGEKLHIAATTCLAVCLGLAINASIRRLVYGTDVVVSRVQRQLIFVSIAYLGMTAATLAAVCYAGTLYRPPEVADVDWQGAARYFIPILVMPYFLAGTLLCLLPGRASRYVQSAAVLGLLAFTIFYYRETAQIPRDYARDLWDYYPGDVRELDAIAEEYDLQYGLAGYWHARRYTLLSRNGLRVHQILAHPVSTSLMRPYPWLSNAHWYFETPGGGPAPRYQFILVTEGLGTWTPSRKEVIKRFGEPASVITFANGGMYALIYTRPCDVEFQEIAEHEFHFIREKFRFQVGEKVRFPAHALPSLLLGSSPPHERTAIEGCVPAGQLSSGPFMHFREAGTYRVTVASSSSDSEEPIAGWQLFMLHPNGVPSFTASGPIDNGTEMLTSTEMTIQKKQLGEALEVRIHYLGKGRLTLHYVEVERIR